MIELNYFFAIPEGNMKRGWGERQQAIVWLIRKFPAIVDFHHGRRTGYKSPAGEAGVIVYFLFAEEGSKYSIKSMLIKPENKAYTLIPIDINLLEVESLDKEKMKAKWDNIHEDILNWDDIA